MHPIVRALLAAAIVSLASAAEAKVLINVDLDTQTMHVEAGDKVFDWKVSSGKPGFETPAGSFGVLWMDKDHHSDEYDGAYMPDAIFFAPGFAIHGFGKSPWGHKASHGCIRIPVAKAEILFGLVQAEGARVTITGYSPTVAPTVASVERKNEDAAGSNGGFYGQDPGGDADGPVVPTRRSRAADPDGATYSGVY